MITCVYVLKKYKLKEKVPLRAIRNHLLDGQSSTCLCALSARSATVVQSHLFTAARSVLE